MPIKELKRLHLDELYEELANRTEQILQLEEKYRDQMEQSPYAIITIDEDSTISYANKAVEAIFGYKPSEILSKNITMLMPESYRVRHLSSIAEYLETGKRHVNWDSTVMKGRKKDGTHFPIELAFSEFVKPDGRHFTAIVKPLTDERI